MHSTSLRQLALKVFCFAQIVQQCHNNLLTSLLPSELPNNGSPGVERNVTGSLVL